MRKWAKKLPGALGVILMRRKRRNNNIIMIAAIAALAVVLFACVPLVGDWILEEFIYTGKLECFREVKLEAGQDLPGANAFFADGSVDASFLTDMSAISTRVPGTYPIELTADDHKYSSTLVIADTVAPTGTGVDVTAGSPNGVTADAFVTDILDATDVTAAFAEEPDWTVSGQQTVTVLLTDAGGNTATVQATLTYTPDTQPPEILGAKNLYSYVGDPISYKTGVTVRDNTDPKPKLEIDNSQVDITKAGTYDVVYRAMDAAGNSTAVTVTLTVREKPAGYVDPETVYAEIDAILAKFIKAGMTDREKAEAVYVWTRRGVHLQYGSGPHIDDYIQQAYSFLHNQNLKGDCYSFHAIQKIMLERLNIPTVDVRKIKNDSEDSNHVWLLVSVDGGKNYYHYDNTWSKELCLVTDAQLDTFSALVDSHPFNRNPSLYPATPTEKLPASTLPWEDPAILGAKP